MEDLFRTIYTGVTTKNWFLVAGAALSLVVLAAHWALDKWAPKWSDADWKRIAITAALSGFGAVATALLASKDVATTVTLMGAVKVWAAAVWAYVTARKLLPAKAAA